MALVAVAASPAIEALRIVLARPHLELYGDQALLALGARRAAQLDQLVGPYSRNGFHHPGPAVLYLLAPFVRFLEPAGSGLYLGAVAINAAALVAAVAVFWRRLGPLAALWAAASIDLFCVAVGVGTLREPWNPYLVVAPMVLFVVLWAAGMTGSAGAALWALVLGSYLVQTHIATAPLAVVMGVVLLGGPVVRWVRDGRQPSAGRAAWGRSRLSGAGALVLIWLPPAVELARDHPDNLQLLWTFFTTTHPAPPLGKALQVSASAISILPFGNHDYVLTLHRAPLQIVVTAVLLGLGVVAAFSVGRRRHQPMSGPLAVTGVLGIVIGTLSLTRVDGPVSVYFAVWLAFVPLSLLLAIGAAVVGTTGPDTGRSRPTPVPRRPVAVIGIAVALLVTGTTVGSEVRLGPVSRTTGSGPWPPADAGSARGRARTLQVTAALSRAAESVLGPGDRSVSFTLGSNGAWPYLAGVIVDLEGRGVHSTVAPVVWELYFGHERAPGRPTSVAFDLSLSSDTSGVQTSAGIVIADTDGAVLTYERTGA